jgi:ATP-dependent DNA ligase
MVELAYNYNPTKDYGVSNWWASPKYDGVRGIFDITNNGLFTRQGKRIWGVRTIEESCRAYVESFKDTNIDIETVEGELWMPGVDFPTISGEVNKFQCDDKNLILKVFVVKSNMTSNEMISNLPDPGEYPLLEPVEYQSILNTPVSVSEFASNNTYSEEGIVLRHESISYTEGRSHNLLKVKKMYTSEFTITSINKGSGKYSGSLGSINITNMINDVMINSRIGTGFTDQERNTIWNNQSEYLGRSVEILYMGLTSGGSLRQPVFIKVLD